VKQRVPLKNKRIKNLRTQINGKFKFIIMLMKINIKISLSSKIIKRQYICSSMEDSDIVLVCESNNAGLGNCHVLSEQIPCPNLNSIVNGISCFS
jgi:hypothetical protein